ncbi:CRISPR-associated endonuclease Cas3'' [Pseudoroseomonas cervicalis]|uniref:CRISPR-associated endonuclease Cas3'' n=1 Tax=Teichococcus cervicalis TaxID=204525 RepID=UPI0022F1C030|nr:CRISPR-associated endonuclease Cas3'' [Pseudoroseomonas cervicalis]WBV41607.1 CRISPR-associated endonuclease Cas3'' [Pseudoroseomonas cervicalis]
MKDHLEAVGRRAAEFASVFGWEKAASALGRLHDIGKLSEAFQAYIAMANEEEKARKGPDHSTAGAREAHTLSAGSFGFMLANIVAGHHAGLDDAAGLERRLSPQDYRIEPYPGWQDYAGPLPPPRDLVPREGWTQDAARPGFCRAFLTRMLFSCLVDADFLETEAFHRRSEGRPDTRGGHAALTVLRDRLREHMAILDGRGEDVVSRTRSRVLAAAREKASLPPGLFTLTVPTGGGKTLASLTFALEHAARHGLRRVIHVAPFSAIIEQTADVFRQALATEEDVLEHHAQAAWREADDEEGPGGERKLRQAAENWNMPVVVTTAVQLFESLFANRPSRCRKLHNLARSVIVLDEAQALPLGLLRPCLAAVAELARTYGATVVLCTATQPAIRMQDKMEGGLDIPPEREIAPDPPALYAALKRVRVEVRPGKVSDADIAARFAEAPQMLCIVNSRAHARDLYGAIRGQEGAVHLSTLMVPRHRRQMLEKVRQRVKEGLPARIVSTSLIEAGVDLDLPEVWRAVAGVDSIAQAAGRCNRNGRLSLGRTVVFEPAEAPVPRFAKEFYQATREVLRRHEDLLGIDAVRDYFHTLYWQKGSVALDALALEGFPVGVLPTLEVNARDGRFPFRSLAEAFRLIDEAMEPVVVPWDAEALAALRAVGVVEQPSGRLLRRLQPYMVNIPAKARQDWLARGVLRPVHAGLGSALLAFENTDHYDPEAGLDLARLEYRRVESNLF